MLVHPFILTTQDSYLIIIISLSIGKVNFLSYFFKHQKR